MFATLRPAAALSLVAALLLGGTAPLLASDRADETSEQTALVTAPALLPVSVTALSPSIFDQALQRPPIDFAGPRQERPSDLTTLRRGLYVSFAALQIMDAVSTRNALNNGAREANPAMGAVAKNSAALFAVKAGTAAATTFFAEKLAKKHPKRAAIVMAVLNAGYAAVVMHNYRVARSAR